MARIAPCVAVFVGVHIAQLLTVAAHFVRAYRLPSGYTACNCTNTLFRSACFLTFFCEFFVMQPGHSFALAWLFLGSYKQI